MGTRMGPSLSSPQNPSTSRSLSREHVLTRRYLIFFDTLSQVFLRTESASNMKLQSLVPFVLLAAGLGAQAAPTFAENSNDNGLVVRNSDYLLYTSLTARDGGYD